MFGSGDRLLGNSDRLLARLVFGIIILLLRWLVVSFLDDDVLILLIFEIDFLNLNSLHSPDQILIRNVVLLHYWFVLDTLLVCWLLLFLLSFAFWVEGASGRWCLRWVALILIGQCLLLHHWSGLTLGCDWLCKGLVNLHAAVICLIDGGNLLLVYFAIVDLTVCGHLGMVSLMSWSLGIALESQVIILCVSRNLIRWIIIVIVLNIDNSRAVVDVHVRIVILLLASLASLPRSIFLIIVWSWSKLRLAHVVF